MIGCEVNDPGEAKEADIGTGRAAAQISDGERDERCVVLHAICGIAA